MLPTAVVLEIRRLLDEDRLSQRAIARKLRVSRGVVGNIANGRRGLHGRAAAAEAAPPDDCEPAATRCPSCGGMVYAPCVLCQARAHRRREEELRRLTRQPPRRPPVRAA